MNILIFGISNVGKSSIGKRIAEKLQYEFIDIDDEIKKYYGYQMIADFIRCNPHQVYIKSYYSGKWLFGDMR